MASVKGTRGPIREPSEFEYELETVGLASFAVYAILVRPESNNIPQEVAKWLALLVSSIALLALTTEWFRLTKRASWVARCYSRSIELLTSNIAFFLLWLYFGLVFVSSAIGAQSWESFLLVSVACAWVPFFFRYWHHQQLKWRRSPTGQMASTHRRRQRANRPKNRS